MRTIPKIPMLAVAAFLLADASHVALAGPPPHAGKKGKAAVEAGSPGRGGSPTRGFSSREATIIRDWFSRPRNLEGLPPGLAKREALPPGLAKQVRRNGTLPPGLEKKLHPLPPSLIDLLPPLRRGTRRVILGHDVLVLDERTSAVIDILSGVVRFGQTF